MASGHRGTSRRSKPGEYQGDGALPRCVSVVRSRRDNGEGVLIAVQPMDDPTAKAPGLGVTSRADGLGNAAAEHELHREPDKIKIPRHRERRTH